MDGGQRRLPRAEWRHPVDVVSFSRMNAEIKSVDNAPEDLHETSSLGNLGYLLLVACTLVVACTHQAPVASRVPPDRIRIIEHPTPLSAGQRLAIQFNDEPPIFYVADGHGGPPILYHGKTFSQDQLKSIIILKGKEARERFGDQTLDAAILIEFK